MTSPVEIVNQALDACRARATVTSINPSDGSKAGDVASRQYQPRIDALSRAAYWNTCRYQAALTLLKAAQGTPENPSGSSPQPPPPWLYEYAWPSTPYCLAARFLVPPVQVQPGGVPIMTNIGISQPPFSLRSAVPFVVSSDLDASLPPNQIKVILTNISQAQLVYTARVTDPTLWDASFVDAAVAYLAAWLCEPITGSDKLTAGLIGMAKDLIGQARIRDGDEGPVSTDNLPDWIRVRAGAPAWAPSYLIGWDQISFPGGGSY